MTPIKPAKRMLAPSRILRPTPSMAGGWHTRKELVDAARESIRLGSKSFAAASRLFDRNTREKAWLLYAWCRKCDDIADGQDRGGPLAKGATVKEQLKRVDGIRALSHRALEGLPTVDMSFDALGQVAMEAGLTPQMVDDVIDGFALDAVGWQPETEEDLLRYCYHVAGAVGVMMGRVMGVPENDSDTLDRACDLGLAFQLSNIARDIAEDAEAGRCYLPRQWLAEAGVPQERMMDRAFRPQLAALAARLVNLSEHYEASARYGAAQLRFRQRWAVLSAAAIYGAIGRQVRARGAAAWDRRVTIPAAAKLRYVAQSLRAALRKPEMPQSWPAVSRGEILIAIRMDGPIAEVPMTPLPDDGAEPQA